ncbi:MAG TPA: endo-1,4-beta-xylanase [Edaphobacter sp.]|uniref:endo-1,4-beta-xylanase n=1 Tax=Edaphobacter sp. TaxID=1934404 RepID=UPI002C4291B1|nr:endo-1,4-beta-xylanase [Edaphobacter sp.]HUZ93900.1 endo-1,4-beta-xylanase [Edaphobacter sp.]
MATRREMLSKGLKAAAAATLSRTAINTRLLAQVPQHPDEMTLNSAPRQEKFPSPDFGRIPKALPNEAKSVAGAGSLKAHAARVKLISGSAVIVRSLSSDPALAELIVDQCGILVPEGELKWRALRPAQDKYDFSQADALFDFAAKHHLLVRGHTLAWHNSVPDWLAAAPSSLDVRKLFVEHIQTVMRRYRGRVHSWDVVNEAILPKDAMPGDLRKSFWYERVGADYIDLAYRTAREADPKARLTYNDYGVEYDNAEDEQRRRAILELLRGMQARKVPLDAVGIQSHIKAASTSTIGKGLADYIAAIHAIGLEVYLTELDVNEDDIASNEIVERDRVIAQTYRDFLDVALGNTAVKLVLTWGISDRRTWLNDGPTHHRKQPNRPQRSLPFDVEYRPVPAFFAMRESFDRHRVKERSGDDA